MLSPLALAQRLVRQIPLPRDLRRSVRPATELHPLILARETRAMATGAAGPAERFVQSLAAPLDVAAWARDHGDARRPRPPS